MDLRNSKTARLGLRPTECTLVTSVEADGTVLVVESLGNATDIMLRGRERDLHRGRPVRLDARTAEPHVFDAVTQLRI